MRKLGLVRDIDLALHLPLRYEDETRITLLKNAREGDTVQIEATVTDCEVQLRPRRMLKITVDDGSASCQLTFFSFYASQQKAMAVGTRWRIRGEVKGGFWGRQMLHPTYKKPEGALPQALTPIYPVAHGLPQAYIRRAVASALQRVALPETLPEHAPPPIPNYWDGNALKPLLSLREALLFLHNPSPQVALDTLQDHSHPAWQRLKAEELLAQQLSQYQARQERSRLAAPPLQPTAQQAAIVSQLLAALPFALTAAQQRVVQEITADMARTQPMHRLLQGDVGSGKTVVAALAAMQCIAAGWQCALMAPTEILAEQHFAKLVGWLEPILAPLGKQVAWLSGAQKKKERTAMLEIIASGQAALVVGTHAVIQEQVQFLNLALAVIDEQHRFGVAQRLALRQKLAHANLEPHLLMMSATPIPRTLAMSYYADLDVSVIDALPPGRTPIVTRVLPDSRKDELIERLAAQLAQGRQVYWVCPLIEESETLDLSNATATHAELSAALPGVLVGLLHSRMSPAEKKAVMQMFASGLMGLLVATTVIEVGVDVPRASLIIIENAERLGLAQLHQLRGRVGRGTDASSCVLLYQLPLSQMARQRLDVLRHTSDGFVIAEKDLELRGPGELLGTRQTGLAGFRIADLARDAGLLPQVHALADHLLLHSPQTADRLVARWVGSSARYAAA